MISMFCTERRHLTCLGDDRQVANLTSHTGCACDCHEPEREWCPFCHEFNPGTPGVVDGLGVFRCDICDMENVYDLREVDA